MRRRHARALSLSSMALQSRTRLAMVPDRSPAEGLLTPVTDSIRAMIAATNSASGSRAGVSGRESVLPRMPAVTECFGVTGRLLTRRAAGAVAEAAGGAAGASLVDHEALDTLGSRRGTARWRFDCRRCSLFCPRGGRLQCRLGAHQRHVRVAGVVAVRGKDQCCSPGEGDADEGDPSLGPHGSRRARGVLAWPQR